MATCRNYGRALGKAAVALSSAPTTLARQLKARAVAYDSLMPVKTVVGMEAIAALVRR